MSRTLPRLNSPEFSKLPAKPQAAQNPFRCIWREVCDSTQELAKAWVSEAHSGFVCFAAKEQRKGRGRVGRTWISPPGGLYCTVILPASFFPLALTPILGGVSVGETLAHWGVSAQLKWPNDIFVEGKKVSGILCELYRGFVLMGIGVNCHLPLEQLPSPLRQETTSLHLYAPHVSPEQFLEQLLVKLYQRGMRPPKEVLSIFRAHDALLNSPVEVTLGDEMTYGIARGIDDRGYLLLETESGVKAMAAGDLKVRKSSNPSESQK